MRKGIKVVTGMLAGLFILGAGMQVEAGFNLGKAFGNVGVKANVPAAKDSVPTVGNSGVGMTIRASCDLPYANIYGGSAMRVRIEGNTIIYPDPMYICMEELMNREPWIQRCRAVW